MQLKLGYVWLRVGTSLPFLTTGLFLVRGGVVGGLLLISLGGLAVPFVPLKSTQQNQLIRKVKRVSCRRQRSQHP
jgi:hypothetical protein